MEARPGLDHTQRHLANDLDERRWSLTLSAQVWSKKMGAKTTGEQTKVGGLSFRPDNLGKQGRFLMAKPVDCPSLHHQRLRRKSIAFTRNVLEEISCLYLDGFASKKIPCLSFWVVCPVAKGYAAHNPYY